MNINHEFHVPSHRSAQSERGIAMIIALLAMTLMLALGTSLMLSTLTETKIVTNFRSNSESLYAADAAVERALDDLLTVPDWNTLLDGSTKSALTDGAPSGTRTLPDGTTFNLDELRNMANCQKTTACTAGDLTTVTNERPWALNNPTWQLYAYGRLNDVLPQGGINSPYYVVVMIADDPSEDDDDPLHDSQVDGNLGKGVLAMRAEAFGPKGNHKVIELTISRTATTELERGYTGQRGQDEQNRRARKAAVQSPGKALTNQALNLATGSIS